MFQIARLNTIKFAALQTRSFTVAPVLALKSASAKPKKITSPELRSLQNGLKKEKAVLQKLKDKIKKINENEKTKKVDSAQKKLESKALKPYRKLSGLNVFVKENIQGTLAETAQKWSSLSDSEKEPYTQKAEKINEEKLKLYAPKPTKPIPAYARFTKETWEPSNSFAEASKIASDKWKKLTEEEKNSYRATDEEWDAYRKEYDSWKDGRLKLASK